MLGDSETRVMIRVREPEAFGGDSRARVIPSLSSQLRSENSMCFLTFISVADQRRKAELHSTLWV